MTGVDFADHRLDTGLRVVAVRRGTGPLVEARLHVPAPALTPNDLAAQALLAALLTARHTPGRASSTPAGAAVEFNVGADYRRLVMSASGAVGGASAVVGIIVDAVRGVEVPDADFANVRQRTQARLRLGAVDPGAVARSTMLRHLYGNHPVARPSATPDDVAGLDPAAVHARAAAVLCGRDAVLIVVGPRAPAESVDLARAAFADWSGGDCAPAAPPLPTPACGGPTLVPRPGAVQSQIRLRAPALLPDDSRYPALLVANNAFGAGISSRLGRRLRAENGYTYRFSSYFDAVPGTSLLAVDADTATGRAAAVLGAIGAELGRMRGRPPATDETRAAARRAAGALMISLASRAALATSLNELAAAGVDPLLLFTFAGRLRRVNAAQVAEIATEFFGPERFRGVVIGDLPAGIGSQHLREFGAAPHTQLGVGTAEGVVDRVH